MIDWSWILSGGALALAGLVSADRVRLARTVARLRQRHESLGDEIWEVRNAVEARDRAEAASEAKSRFLATVSHEVRTPLNGILGIAELLVDTPLDREQLAYVEAVKTSGRALATLIDEILDFSRIEAGRLELTAEPFDLAALVEGVVELLAPRAQDKGLEIASFVAGDVPAAVVGDPVRLRQVLTNLAGNAVKFTVRGGVGMSVSVSREGRIRFAVSDTGPGVPHARREAIFREFEQADDTTTRRHGGTGLGLAISRRIVELMGGTLGLEDRPGGGSEFAFEVALPPAPAERRRPDASLAGVTALIVAASPFQAPYLAAQLEGNGASVLVHDDPERALRWLEGPTVPDVVLVDCALGEAAACRLADAARAAGVRQAFLLFSPFERRAFGQKLVSGYEGWLVKPVRASSLATRLAGSAPHGVEARTAAAASDCAPRRGPGPLPLTRATHRRRGSEPLRVLLAEDNEINTLVAMNFLGKLGAQVVHAADGTAAVDLALAGLRGEAPAFDAILMDVSMPGLDGFEATRRIRFAENMLPRPPVRIVALTAHAFSEDHDRCRSAGMDAVLTKPLAFDCLEAALRPREALQATG